MKQPPTSNSFLISSLLPIWPLLQIPMRSIVQKVCPRSIPRTLGQYANSVSLTLRTKLLHRVLLHLMVHLGSGHFIWCPVRYRQHHRTCRPCVSFWSYGRARNNWTRVSNGTWWMGTSAAAVTYPDGESGGSFLSIWINSILYLEVSRHPLAIDSSDGVLIRCRVYLSRFIVCLLPTHSLRRIHWLVCSGCDGGRGQPHSCSSVASHVVWEDTSHREVDLFDLDHRTLPIPILTLGSSGWFEQLGEGIIGLTKTIIKIETFDLRFTSADIGSIISAVLVIVRTPTYWILKQIY